MILDQRTTQIGKLRVATAQRDSLSVRLRYESAMSAANLKPGNLPPAAIVCIRRFSDPNPGLLDSHKVGAPVSLAWEKAVAEGLGRIVSGAIRPGEVSVPEFANAVIFVDEAELLACLARDWCTGIVPRQWWWQSLLRGNCDTPAILKAWFSHVEHVPAALQTLSMMGSAVSFAGKLESSFASCLLRRITETFALPLLKRCMERTVLGDVQVRIKHEKETGGANIAGRRLSTSPPSRREIRSTWLSFVPEVTQGGLTVQQRCLLGAGLMLIRNPTLARADYFARDLARFAEECGESLDDASVEDGFRVAWDPADVSHNPGDFSHAKLNGLNRLVISTAKPGPGTSQYGATPALGRTLELNGVGADLLRELREIGPPDIAAPHTPGEAAGKPPTVRATRIEPFVETGFGGLFYLINLGIFLNLYGDFTSPNEPGINLSIWDFIGLVGERIIGDEIRNDSVWSMLADLARRDDGEPMGGTFEPPGEWRIPPEWFAPFRSDVAWLCAVDRDHLRVFHPLLFTLIDVTVESAEPSIQLSRELNRYGLGDQLVHRFEPDLDSESLFSGGPSITVDARAPLQRWLDHLLPYLLARLNRALGLGNSESLSRLLFEHRARVFATATHVDVEFSLAELPIELRMSGLDRDPGWVPAAGRIIRFHYR
jgi:hypothetical protein